MNKRINLVSFGTSEMSISLQKLKESFSKYVMDRSNGYNIYTSLDDIKKEMPAFYAQNESIFQQKRGRMLMLFSSVNSYACQKT